MVLYTVATLLFVVVSGWIGVVFFCRLRVDAGLYIERESVTVPDLWIAFSGVDRGPVILWYFCFCPLYRPRPGVVRGTHL